jgi:hypothetical protein
MEKNYLSDNNIDEIDNFLSFFADDIYTDCRFKKIITFEDSDEQSKLFGILDCYLNKITKKFELELFLEKSPGLIQAFQKNISRKNMSRKNMYYKLSNYYFGYQPSIHYLFNIKLIYNQKLKNILKN